MKDIRTLIRAALQESVSRQRVTLVVKFTHNAIAKEMADMHKGTRSGTTARFDVLNRKRAEELQSMLTKYNKADVMSMKIEENE